LTLFRILIFGYIGLFPKIEELKVSRLPLIRVSVAVDSADYI
jgi:hypothetical protein